MKFKSNTSIFLILILIFSSTVYPIQNSDAFLPLMGGTTIIDSSGSGFCNITNQTQTMHCSSSATTLHITHGKAMTVNLFPSNQTIFINATGSIGPVGPQGPTGATGATGAAGSQIYTGAGSPSSGLGISGDFYINVTNGDYYIKSGGSWILQGNLTGPTGPQGPRGFNGTNGSNGRNGTNGINGTNGTSAFFNSINCSANQFLNAYNNATHLASCASAGTVTGSSNAGKATGSVGTLATSTSTTIKGRNMTGISPISVTKTNDTDISISCPTCLTSTPVHAINAGSGISVNGTTGTVVVTNTGVKSLIVSGSATGNATTGNILLNTKTYQNNTGGNLGTHGVGPYSSTTVAGVLQFLSLISANPTCVISSNSTNQILTCTFTGLTSINGQSGPSLTINRGSVTNMSSITNSSNTISYQMKNNVVLTNSSQQDITKNLVIDKLLDTSNIVGVSDQTKQLEFLLSGETTGVTTTIRNNATSNQGINIPATRETETFALRPGLNATTPSDPTGTTSTTGVMTGMLAGFTPQVTGRIQLIIEGDIGSSAAADGAKVDARTGTGASPSNGAVLSGTVCGKAVQITAAAVAANTVPFTLVCQVKGLTVGTHIWIELGQYAITAGTASVKNISVSIIEI